MKHAPHPAKSQRNSSPASLSPQTAGNLFAAHTQGNLKMNSQSTVNKPTGNGTTESATRAAANAASSSDADLNPLWVIAGAMAIFFAAGAGLLAMG
jgi:hypothetical protein